MITWARRTMWLLVIGAGVGIGVTWWRDRNALPSPTNPPEWPPLEPPAPSAVPEAARTPRAEPAVEAEPAVQADETSWVEPADDGSCPLTHPIKANDKSGIFHLPGGRFYDRTRAERCYSNPDAAIADGYRQAKS